MPKKRLDGATTRQNVLEGACEIFAEKGYRDATIAEICDRAGANIAAVNYHFGDKQTLYANALRHAFEIASKRYPINGGLPPTTPAHQRLRAHVEAHLRRTFSADEASHFPRIMVKELAEPTLALRPIIRDVLRPHRDHLRGVLRDLLGEDVGDERVRLCVISIISQCYFFGFNRAIRERFFNTGKATEERLVELIDHITGFCLAGLKDIRNQLGHDIATSASPAANTRTNESDQ